MENYETMTSNDFQKVANNYHEMVLELNDMSKEFEEGVVSPEVYEQMKRTIEPLKRNYETLNYVDYLLNKPVRKQKQATYERQSKKQLKECRVEKEVLDENKKSLEELKTLL